MGYKEDTGEEPPRYMMEHALSMFASNEVEQEEAAIAEEVDPEVFAKEMEDALDNVKKLAANHREEFVEKIAGTIAEVNGQEPTHQQIVQIMGRIKEELQHEAREEFLDDVEEQLEDEQEEDYDPMNEHDQRQIQDDKKMDLLENLEQVTQQKDNEEEQKKVKILVTPVRPLI